MAHAWTTARHTPRMDEIRSQLADMDRESAGSPFDQESRDTWNRLNSEYDDHTARTSFPGPGCA